MGGNLFKLGRISRDKYLEIETEVRLYLDRKLGNFYRIPRYYSNKSDFGDMDIVVSMKGIQNKWEKVRQEIVKDLCITQYKSDGHVFSTVYQNLQVDYFVACEQFFESTYNYLSFNDLGNLIGKICRKFNLKYGEKGIAYVYRRQNGQYKKDLIVSTDFQEICTFLELDYQGWERGFEDLEEIFAWVIASPYFSVQSYLEKSKSLERREKERKTIQKFLEYIQKNQVSKTYQYLENRDEYIPVIAQSFPESNLLKKIAEEKDAERRDNLIKSKFNGKLVMELIDNIKNKEIGKLIVGFQNNFEDFEKFILESSQEEINQEVIKFYNDLFARKL